MRNICVLKFYEVINIMKKLLILGMMLSIFMFTAGAEKFSFKDYSPTSPAVLKTKDSVSKLNGSDISYPRITATNPKATKAIQKTMNNFVKKLTDKKDVRSSATYEVMTNNSSLISVLFTIERNDMKNKTADTYYKALTFDAVTGKELKLGDLLVSGYEKSLETVMEDKISQLSIPVNSAYKGVEKNQEFYIQKSGIVFFFTPNKYTEFGDGQLFLPFELTDLRGLLK